MALQWVASRADAVSSASHRCLLECDRVTPRRRTRGRPSRTMRRLRADLRRCFDLNLSRLKTDQSGRQRPIAVAAPGEITAPSRAHPLMGRRKSSVYDRPGHRDAPGAGRGSGYVRESTGDERLSITRSGDYCPTATPAPTTPPTTASHRELAMFHASWPPPHPFRCRSLDRRASGNRTRTPWHRACAARPPLDRG
jgi:hypothetical protein